MQRTFQLAGALFAPLAMVGLLVAQDAQACGEKGATTAYQKLTVQQLSTLMASAETAKTKPVIVDVNAVKTRTEKGVIPGAILLSSASQYQATKELPKDRDRALVFYCANTKCGASKTAAERAVNSGYNNVWILPAGIAGWRDAGMATEQPKQAQL